MADENGEARQAGMSQDALRREAERAALREARLAEALRANLRRRKDQARGRARSEVPDPQPVGNARDDEAAT